MKENHTLEKRGDVMNLADRRTMEALLQKNGFSFRKSMGQNFLIDDSVCPRMADSVCGEDVGVLEIGPGIGVLTKELALRCRKVAAIELDERLQAILPVTLERFSNVHILYGDVLKLDLAHILQSEFPDCGRLCVCANLPYNITSPILMRLLESRLPVDSITVMVQKEAAQRLCAEVGSSKAGAITAAVRYYAEPRLLFEVSRNSFYPAPKVDSAVIRLTVLKQPPIDADEACFFRLVKACFAQRRKTLLNTVSHTLPVEKDVLRRALRELDLPETVRGEALSLEQLAALSKML